MNALSFITQKPGKMGWHGGCVVGVRGGVSSDLELAHLNHPKICKPSHADYLELHYALSRWGLRNRRLQGCRSHSIWSPWQGKPGLESHVRGANTNEAKKRKRKEIVGR